MESEEGSTTRTIIICAGHLILIKSRKLRWAGHVARIEEGRRAFRILTNKSTGKITLEKTIFVWILKK